MVNAGLVGTTIAFDYLAEFWQQVFPKLVLKRGAAVKTDGQIAMMVRKNNPRLKAELNKGLFAFASYNAGPARISQFRKRARRHACGTTASTPTG
jgi:membrane-bound lytic murein transglycosylase MltF